MKKRKLNIRSVIKHACKCCNCPELMEKGVIVVEFTDAFSSSLGEAEWFKSEGFGKIRLNEAEWHKMDRESQYELLCHEVCHLISDVQYGRFKDNIGDHSLRWKLLMQACGFDNPQACIDV